MALPLPLGTGLERSPSMMSNPPIAAVVVLSAGLVLLTVLTMCHIAVAVLALAHLPYSTVKASLYQYLIGPSFDLQLLAAAPQYSADGYIRPIASPASRSLFFAVFLPAFPVSLPALSFEFRNQTVLVLWLV